MVRVPQYFYEWRRAEWSRRYKLYKPSSFIGMASKDDPKLLCWYSVHTGALKQEYFFLLKFTVHSKTFFGINLGTRRWCWTVSNLQGGPQHWPPQNLAMSRLILDTPDVLKKNTWYPWFLVSVGTIPLQMFQHLVESGVSSILLQHIRGIMLPSGHSQILGWPVWWTTQ